MRRALPALLLLALPLGACSVSGAGISPSGVAFNQCERDADCPGSDGLCINKVCQASGGSLTSLIVAITPPPNLVGVNSFTYLVDFTKDGTLGKGSGGKLDILLDPPVEIANNSGTVHIDTSTDCKLVWNRPGTTPLATGDDGLIPAMVTFTPSQSALGVPVDSYSAGPSARGLDFEITLPAGEYDVYVKPAFPLAAPVDSTCEVPPRLLKHETVASKLDFKLPAPPKPLMVNVTWPLAQPYMTGAELTDPFLKDPLQGWTLDLIDQDTGRVLSTVEPLVEGNPPLPGQSSVIYSVTLPYSHAYSTVNGVLQPANDGTELLRLTPPTYDPRFTDASVPLTAPTILAQLDGALVDADGKPAPAQIVQSSPLATPVTVQFQTALSGDLGGTPTPAGVIITAEQLDGITGLSTSFSRTVQVGDDGIASVDLLPGRYRVVGAPKAGCTNDGCLALAETEWVIKAAPPSQSGKVIEFSPAQVFSGYATIGGRAVTGATVHAVASSLALDQNVLNLGNASSAVVPRATSGLVDSDGSFSFDADAGVFDVRVEPDPSTGYGWLVRPGLVLPDNADALNGFGLSLPIIYRGTVSMTTNGVATPIPKALIRAYAFLKPDGSVATKPIDDTDTAIEIAETYADDTSGDPGVFSLLIPKNISGN
jgi:hypothetical protein